MPSPQTAPASTAHVGRAAVAARACCRRRTPRRRRRTPSPQPVVERAVGDAAVAVVGVAVVALPRPGRRRRRRRPATRWHCAAARAVAGRIALLAAAAFTIAVAAAQARSRPCRSPSSRRSRRCCRRRTARRRSATPSPQPVSTACSRSMQPSQSVGVAVVALLAELDAAVAARGARRRQLELDELAACPARPARLARPTCRSTTLLSGSNSISRVKLAARRQREDGEPLARRLEADQRVGVRAGDPHVAVLAVRVQRCTASRRCRSPRPGDPVGRSDRPSSARSSGSKRPSTPEP